MASLIASFNVRDPDDTPRTSAPSNRMRNTFNSCRRMSSVPMYTTHSNPISAHTVAVATPRSHHPRHRRMRPPRPPRPRPGDHATLSHPLHKQPLPQAVVDLVRPGVQQIL